MSRNVKYLSQYRIVIDVPTAAEAKEVFKKLMALAQEHNLPVEREEGSFVVIRNI